MPVTVEIFSQGEEVVTGQTVDSNAAWLSQQLIQMGFTVTRHSTVGDKLDDLTTLLQEISVRADCCICSGGLGPTVDDLTAEAVARAFSLPLQFDTTAYQQITQYFTRRNRPMPESNRKQAMLPKGTLRLDNEWGTAPGFALHYGQCWFAFVPGVPFEMRHLFSEQIKPLLQSRYTLRPCQLVTIKTVGIGESDIQERLQSFKLPASVQLSFRTGSNENQTKLLFSPDFPKADIYNLANTAAALIGEAVFTIDGLNEQSGDLPTIIAQMLRQQQQTLVVMESLSHGLIAGKLLGQPCLKEALYAATIEQLFFRVGLAYRQQNEQTSAALLAAALRAQSGADFALVQLYQGMQRKDRNFPELQDKKTAATVYNALATDETVQQQNALLGGTLQRKQNQAALTALDQLRRYLQNRNQ